MSAESGHIHTMVFSRTLFRTYALIRSSKIESKSTADSQTERRSSSIGKEVLPKESARHTG